MPLVASSYRTFSVITTIEALLAHGHAIRALDTFSVRLLLDPQLPGLSNEPPHGLLPLVLVPLLLDGLYRTIGARCIIDMGALEGMLGNDSPVTNRHVFMGPASDIAHMGVSLL